jgi:hypothetical protein
MLCGCTDDEPGREPALLIAPFLAGQFFCEESQDNPAIDSDETAAWYCGELGSTGARRIATALDAIGPAASPSGRYLLGYTLIVPLFRYFRKQDGRWQFQTAIVAQNLATIAAVGRPVVLYLSSNHFIDSGRELCLELAQDPANLMANAAGPLQPDRYFDSALIPWTLVDQTAPVNVLRREAFEKVLTAIAALPEPARALIKAISFLGETHHLFPDFFAGPRIDCPLSSGTDYAPAAVADFRAWLAQRYGRVEDLNAFLDADFVSFDAIDPPTKNIISEHLDSFLEHIDAYAAGTVSVVGWVHDAMGRPLQVDVYLDGKRTGRAHYGLSRTDVTDALSEIADPNVGFRFNLDYREAAVGIHTLDVVVEVAGAPPVRLARQSLVIVNRRQDPSSVVACADDSLPGIGSCMGLSGALDAPRHLTAVFYNPLAQLWLQYRNGAVRDYLETFAAIAVRHGVPVERLFSHQVSPALVGSWHADLLAADASKQPSPYHRPGTTLYGGAAFGAAFVTMKAELAWGPYGVSELHPMVRLRPDQYQAMFEMHRTQGALFVAPYFLYVGPRRLLGAADSHGRFQIAPDNSRLGSDLFYQAIQDAMRQ